MSQHSDTALDRWEEKLDRMIEGIAHSPRMFQEVEPKRRPHDIRRMVIDDYQVFYAVRDDRRMITMINIFHSAQDIGTLLRRQLRGQPDV